MSNKRSSYAARQKSTRKSEGRQTVDSIVCPVVDGEPMQRIGSMVIFTDGSCPCNPGRGGWGFCYQRPDSTWVEASGGQEDTTNNRMELEAVIQAMEHVKRNAIEGKVDILSDSQYVVRGAMQWRHGWKRNGWAKSAKGSPEKLANADLWKLVDSLMDGRDIRLMWIKGHVGIAGNERADSLASQGCEHANASSLGCDFADAPFIPNC